MDRADSSLTLTPKASEAGQALEALLGQLVEPGYRLAFSILRDRHAAEDAVQEAALKAWKNRRTVREGGNLRAWFLTIVANHCRSVRRGRWWRVLPLPDAAHVRVPAEEDLARRIDLRRALARLGDRQRLILALYFFLDLPLEEVAVVLNISVGAAKSRLYRAAHQLRPDLEASEVLDR
jgi:RNA polymerase sigma-70 factor (ECF subfamily)